MVNSTEVARVDLEPMADKVNNEQSTKEKGMAHLILLTFYIIQTEFKHCKDQR
jgi:hypothetical protein